MTTYGNLRTANEDKIEIKHGSIGGPHPAKTDGQHRTHTLGGAIAKPSEKVSYRSHKLGGSPGGTTDLTPQKLVTKGGKVGGPVGGGLV
jgi:hypothetical protein